ncbi:unnamed protein product [Caenorhabditis brenneri]
MSRAHLALVVVLMISLGAMLYMHNKAVIHSNLARLQAHARQTFSMEGGDEPSSMTTVPVWKQLISFLMVAIFFIFWNIFALIFSRPPIPHEEKKPLKLVDSSMVNINIEKA